MADAGVDPVAIDVFAHYYRLVESGETGMIPESTIEPVDMPSLADVDVSDEDATDGARAAPSVIKLNGGLGTSMGLDRAKSLLEVRDGLSFLDIIARQVLRGSARSTTSALPLVFMNSFRTSDDTLAGARRLRRPRRRRAAAGLPAEQGAQAPRRRPHPGRRGRRTPTSSGARPGTATSTPRCAAPACSTGCIEAGYQQVFVSNSDNLGATPGPAGRRVVRQRPARRSPSRRSDVRPRTARAATSPGVRRDGRIVLRETAQTLAEDKEALADLSRHRFCSTNNLWFDLAAMSDALDRRDGVLGLPLIHNIKTVDPADPDSQQYENEPSTCRKAGIAFE